jgi:DNA-directed RNA polymerase beta' subunit
VLGGQFNYTARSVIVLDTTLKIDEVSVPYKTFLVVFGGLIIKKLVKKYGWTITKSTNYLKSKFQFDENVYEIMNEILNEEPVHLVLNRNPELVGL